MLKAQGSTEYLVMLGVVLLIALGVVSLLGFFPDLMGESGVSESQLYWKGSAKPISVVDVKNTAGTICGQADKYAYTLVASNSDPDPVYITGIRVDNVSKTFCLQGANAGSSSLSVGPGQVVRINVIGSVCPLDSVKEISLTFTYSTPYLEGKRQAGAKKLAFRCAESASAGGSDEACAVGGCSGCTVANCESSGCTWTGAACIEPEATCGVGSCSNCGTLEECGMEECTWHWTGICVEPETMLCNAFSCYGAEQCCDCASACGGGDNYCGTYTETCRDICDSNHGCA